MLNIATDLGGLDILVDTGFTLTMLHDFLYPYGETVRLDYRDIPIFSSRKFIIGNKDFGRKNLYFLKMQDRLYDIDGFLGMDFIKDHVIYIDFSKSEIYIQ